MALRASIIYTIFIALLIHSYISQEICNYYNDCICTICGENEDYTNCDFINLFCEKGTNVFTSKFLNLKSRYMNYFKREKDNEIFCGQQKDVQIKDNNETAIIKTGQSYTMGKPVHCYYDVNYKNKKYNPLMTYEILDNGDNKLNFDLIVLYQNTTDTKTDLFTYEDLKLGPYSINVTNYDKVELFLDFKANDYSHIDEVFTVKVKLNLKEGEKEDEEDSSINTLFGEIGGAVVGIALIVVIAYCCCCRKKTNEDEE